MDTTWVGNLAAGVGTVTMVATGNWKRTWLTITRPPTSSKEKDGNKKQRTYQAKNAQWCMRGMEMNWSNWGCGAIAWVDTHSLHWGWCHYIVVKWLY
jgi:hypothetical protein